MKVKIGVDLIEAVKKLDDGRILIFRDPRKELMVLGDQGKPKTLIFRDRDAFKGSIGIDLDDTMIKDLIATLKK